LEERDPNVERNFRVELMEELAKKVPGGPSAQKSNWPDSISVYG
jgi:hypothetical protein